MPRVSLPAAPASERKHGVWATDFFGRSLASPMLSPVGRLDRDTSGALLMTDDGALLHRIVSPKSRLAKAYEATLAQDLRGDEAALFASGTLLLESEDTPLAPATLEVLGPRHARLVLTEGRYHQVRRMFAAVGNHVETLHRPRIGGLTLGTLAPGEWRLLDVRDLEALFDVHLPQISQIIQMTQIQGRNDVPFVSSIGVICVICVIRD